MPKKRNTRKHKISIDQKRQTVHETSSLTAMSSPVTVHTNQQTEGTMFSLPDLHKTSISPKKSVEITVISTENYGYLSNDLFRTAVLSGAIIVTEILIKIFFRA